MSSYHLFDPSGKEVTFHDLQDKGPWCQTGATYEQTFVGKYGDQLGLVINPQKKFDPYVPDLLQKSGRLADLKTQNTPFFQAGIRYNMDPQYAVTFNLKDRFRYKELYPNIDIYFWVDWLITGFKGSSNISVKNMTGIWAAPFELIDDLAERSPVHNYAQRQFDTLGNAKGSYVLSLQDPIFKQIV